MLASHYYDYDLGAVPGPDTARRSSSETAARGATQKKFQQNLPTATQTSSNRCSSIPCMLDLLEFFVSKPGCLSGPGDVCQVPGAVLSGQGAVLCRAPALCVGALRSVAASIERIHHQSTSHSAGARHRALGPNTAPTQHSAAVRHSTAPGARHTAPRPETAQRRGPTQHSAGARHRTAPGPDTAQRQGPDTRRWGRQAHFEQGTKEGSRSSGLVRFLSVPADRMRPVCRTSRLQRCTRPPVSRKQVEKRC